MSLELALKETTEAIHQLIAAMHSSSAFTTVTPPPPKADSGKKTERKGPFYWKSLDGLQHGETDTHAGLNNIINSNAGIEITKVEYLQIKEKQAEQNTPEDAFDKAKTLIMKLTTGGYRSEALEILDKFGAKKLGQVPQEKLADVVALAEKALGG